MVDLDFPEYDQPPAEPLELVRSWLVDAVERGVREPRALALATADARGLASNRIVVIISITDRGLVFASHSDSQKGREMAATGWASGLLYWRETGQQSSSPARWHRCRSTSPTPCGRPGRSRCTPCRASAGRASP